MRILAIDHGTVRMGIAISDELKMIAQPLEFIPAEPFSDCFTNPLLWCCPADPLKMRPGSIKFSLSGNE